MGVVGGTRGAFVLGDRDGWAEKGAKGGCGARTGGSRVVPLLLCCSMNLAPLPFID